MANRCQKQRITGLYLAGRDYYLSWDILDGYPEINRKTFEGATDHFKVMCRIAELNEIYPGLHLKAVIL